MLYLTTLVRKILCCRASTQQIKFFKICSIFVTSGATYSICYNKFFHTAELVLSYHESLQRMISLQLVTSLCLEAAHIIISTAPPLSERCTSYTRTLQPLQLSQPTTLTILVVSTQLTCLTCDTQVHLIAAPHEPEQQSFQCTRMQ